MDKIDVVVLTRERSSVNPSLYKTLTTAPWVNSLAFEVSSPLSRARVKAATKCSTEWIAMFDDDIDLPLDWFPKIAEGIDLSSCSAISSIYTEADPHMASYMKAAALFRSPRSDGISYICNTLIRKDAFDGYDPPPCFECEDNLLMVHVHPWLIQKDIGVVHHLKWKSYEGTGRAFKQYGFWSRRQIAKSIVARFGVAVIAMIYSGSPKTVFLHWRKNFQINPGTRLPR